MAYDHDMYEGVQRRTLEACCSESDSVRMEFAKNLSDDVRVCLLDVVSETVAHVLYEARKGGVEVDDEMMDAAKDLNRTVYGAAEAISSLASVFVTEFCKEFLRNGYDEAVESLAKGASAVAFDKVTRAAKKACSELTVEELRELDPEVADLVERSVDALGADGVRVFRIRE